MRVTEAGSNVEGCCGTISDARTSGGNSWPPAVAELEPDLVVIDVSMPVLDGPAAIAQIRQLQPATKVAVLSAEQCSTPPGADAHIEKGTPNDAVIAALRTLCQRTRQSAVD